MKKEKLKIVLDSNIIISAITFSGYPEVVLNLVRTNLLVGIISEEIINEILEVLSKKFFLSKSSVKKTKEDLSRGFTSIIPLKKVNIARDPDDNKIIEAAIEGGCDFIVTGDKDLLELKTYKNIKILTPKDFLEEFSSL